MNEGSNWEALMSAAHFKLDNLTVIVDRNRMIIDRPTEEVMALEPLADKLTAYVMAVENLDGHDFDAVAGAVDAAKSRTSGPTAIIANTIKGKGVDFMENQVPWHYGSVDSALRDKALASIDSMYEGALS